MVTAIVSPTALPRPRISAPKMPERAYGRTARHIVSQRVAPRPSIASRWLSGTAWSTSRLTAVTIGNTISARMSEAVSNEGP